MSPKDIDRRIARMMSHYRLPFRGKSTALNVSARVQRLQLRGLSREQLEEIELFQHFGFSSSPPDDSEIIVIPLGGKTSHCVAIASENGAVRFKLEKKGESALYNKEGDYVWIRDGRIVEIKAAGHVKVDAPSAQFTGDVTVEGNLSVAGDIAAVGNIASAANIAAAGNMAAAGTVSDATGSMTEMREIYDGHNHHENNPVNGNTNAPNQLMDGGP